MSAQDSFAALRTGLQAGDPAAALLFNRFASRLVALASTRLSRQLRPKVDPEDVVQSAFRSFFLCCASERLDLNDADHLWNLLVVFTLRKCGRQADLYRADRRDVRREVAAGPPDDSAAPGPPALAREPTPEEAALLAEAVEQVRARLGSPLKRRVFELSLQGYTVAEIAAELNYYERGVERARAEVRALLAQLGRNVAA